MSDISGYCFSRKLLFLYNVPPIRYNPISPYVDTSYNKFDFDMRRKAEILKYNTSTTGGKITRSQQWTKTISTSVSQSAINCPYNLIKTPSYASGVPGLTLLYNDPDVPLYNYNPNTDAYGFVAIPDTRPFRIVGMIPNEIVTNSKNFLCALQILNIVSSYTTFEIFIPITLQINSATDVQATYSFDIPDLVVNYGNSSTNLVKPETLNAQLLYLNEKISPPTITVHLLNGTYTYSFYIHYENIGLSTTNGYAYLFYLTNPNLTVNYLNVNSPNVLNSFILNSDANQVMSMNIVPATNDMGVSLLPSS